MFVAIFACAQPSLANNTAQSEFRLLVLGDSLTAGYGLPAHESFTAQLEKALRQSGYAVKVINAGVSGDTTAGGLARVDWLLSDEPDMVIVELGANDALRGLSTTMTYNNLDAILTKLKQNRMPVLLAGMQAPKNLGDDYVERFNRIFPNLAERHNVALYPFFLEGVALDPSLNQPDGIHPNFAGVKVIVNNILPFVLDLIPHD
jgi:acyl-CoA thioesterase-1